MPNWCNNYIWFSGDNINMETFLKDVKSLNNGDDMFTALTNYKEEYDIENWISEFGCKWSVKMDEYIKNDLLLQHSLICETAWSPCINFTLKVCEKYGINAFHEFSEPMNNFGGIVRINDEGNIIEEERDNYDEYAYKHDIDKFFLDFTFNVSCGDYKNENQIRNEFPFIDEVHLNEMIQIFNKVEIRNPNENTGV